MYVITTTQITLLFIHHIHSVSAYTLNAVKSPHLRQTKMTLGSMEAMESNIFQNLSIPKRSLPQHQTCCGNDLMSLPYVQHVNCMQP